MRRYFYVLIVATATDLGAPLVQAHHTLLIANSDNEARKIGRRKFRHREGRTNQTVEEIVQVLAW
jgi:hypothetical protein